MYNDRLNVAKRIQMDGQLIADEGFNKEEYETWKTEPEEAKEYSKKRRQNNVLKNVDSVSINASQNLMFNGHELTVNQYGHIKLKYCHLTENTLKAEKVSDRQFVFPDGSEIIINKQGLFILKSSHPNYEDVYIPSVLKRSLGVATEKIFAGEDSYKKLSLHKVIFESFKGNGQQFQELINQDVVLIGALNSVDDLPKVVDILEKQRAENYKSQYEKKGVTVSLKELPTTSPPQIILDTKSFFNTHIKNFIQHIIDNAT